MSDYENLDYDELLAKVRELDEKAQAAEAQVKANEDSPIIRALRKQIKDLQSDLRAGKGADAAMRDEVEAQVAQEMGNDDLNPKGGTPSSTDDEGTEDDIERRVREEAERLAAAEIERLKQQQQFQAVTGLAASVRAVADGAGGESLSDRLNRAKSPEEVDAIMAEHGLAV